MGRRDRSEVGAIKPADVGSSKYKAGLLLLAGLWINLSQTNRYRLHRLHTPD